MECSGIRNFSRMGGTEGAAARRGSWAQRLTALAVGLGLVVGLAGLVVGQVSGVDGPEGASEAGFSIFSGDRSAVRAEGVTAPEGGGSVDLALQLMESRDPVVGGTPLGDLVHTLQVANLGPDAATGIEITVSLPQLTGVTIDGVTPGAGSFDASAGVWMLASLASGEQAELQIAMTIDGEAEVGSDAIVTSAQVTSVMEGDSEPGNDEASVGTSVFDEEEIDFSLFLTDEDPVVPNSRLDLEVTLSNNGPGKAVGHRVVIERPANVTLQDVSFDEPWDCRDDDISPTTTICIGPDLAAGQFQEIILQIVTPDVPTTLEFSARLEWSSYERSTVALIARELVRTEATTVDFASLTILPGPTEPRTAHTGTLLPSNEILVVGGETNSSPESMTSAVEIFDPQERQWRFVSSLAQARSHHASLLLPSGGVLVVGGRGIDAEGEVVPISTVELYDPRNNTWSSMPSLQVPRSNPTLTQLSDGSVLVVGGIDSSVSALSSAETLAPGADSWVLTSPLLFPRAFHAATLLRTEEVLVSGRSLLDGTVSNEVEIFDPDSRTWNPVGPMDFGRAQHTATLLSDGRVLVDGGASEADPYPEIFDPVSEIWLPATRAEENSRDGHSASLMPDGRVFSFPPVEIYDPSEDSWDRVVGLETLRIDHTATVLAGGQVVVAGGRPSPLQEPALVSEIYGRADLTQENVPPLNLGGSHSALMLSDGKVLVTGGRNDDDMQVSVYDPQGTGSWEFSETMPRSRIGHRQLLLDDERVLLTGGAGSSILVIGGSSQCSASPGENPPAAIRNVDGSWSEIEMNVGCRSHHTMTRFPDGRVWVTGGEVKDIISTVSYHRTTEVFDPTCGCFYLGLELPSPRSRHTATLLPSGHVLIVGGENQERLNDVLLFNPSEGAWTEASPMSVPRSRHASVLLPSGQVLVAGGEGLGAEIYDPASDSWRLTSEQPQVNSEHPTLTLLPSGMVLLLGAENGLEQGGAQIYDPLQDMWSQVPGNFGRREHSATLLQDGEVLILGGVLGGASSPIDADPQVFALDPVSERVRRPEISSWPAVLNYNDDAPMQITGTGFRGVSEGSSGTTQNSSTAFPLIHLQALNGGPSGWLEAAEPHPITPGEDFWDGSMTLDIAHIPPIFHPGWHRLTVFANGVPSRSEIVQLECSLEVDEPRIAAIFDADGNEIEVLENPRVPVGGRVRFEVTSRGGRSFQWQRNFGNSENPDWRDLDGAAESFHLTPQVTGAESGSQFRVQVSSGCMEATSEVVTFTIDDALPPVVSVVSPSGGEHWPLSTTTAPSHQQVVYDVNDATTWVCQLRAELIYSNDQGGTWHVAPANVEEPENTDGELPRDFGAPGCAFGQRILSGALGYAVPQGAPAGQSGSLYKIRLRAVDQAGNEATAESPHPFFILPPNDQSVRTLILFHPERLGVDCGAVPEPEICRKVRELAQHPSVVGRVIDLGANGPISRLYEAWDNADQQAEDSGTQEDRDTANLEANKVLFKSGGIHELLRGLAGIFEGLESILLLGGDRVIPMARVSDDSGLLGEAAYTEGADPDLQPNRSTVGRAIDARIYLSDDPLATLAQPVNNASDLYREGIIFLPDVAVGRLVETPEQIVAAIRTFQQHEGVLDLTARQNKVLVTGYDFLTDSARIIEEKWRCSLDPDDDTADGRGCDPEEGTKILLPDFNRVQLEEALCGDPEPYALINLNGHANHYQEGVPGAGGHTDIQGVGTERLVSETLCGGQPLDLDGAVIYAVGCHGGLPVPDDADGDTTLDLPQVFLQRGAMAYLANTGYGWGLKEGIGYSERLMEIFTDQLRVGDSVTVGRAMLDAKKRYFQEARKLDAYGIKTLMQWTTFGFPMARIHTGLGGNEDMQALRPIEGPARESDALTAVEQLGPVTVRRSWTGAGGSGVGTEGTALPSHMDRIRLTLEFSEDSYVKRTSEGERVSAQEPGCPSPNGCYYTLNGLGERGTGDTDRPIQPYALVDSGLGGTSQHGVLWLGGKYKEESGWRPIFAELISNGEDTGSNHGSAPQVILSDPIETPLGRRDQGNSCRVSDLETSTMVVPAGEVRMSEPTDNSGPVVPSDYDIQRRYNEIYMETFYFNNPDRPSDNCDRQGPLGLVSGQGPFDGRYHETNGSTLSWKVPVTDEAGVWRVVVVYDVQRDSEPQDGEWQHLELTHDPVSQSWVGEQSFTSGQTVTYVIQAVDNRGNVSWLRHLQGAANEEGGAGQSLGEGGPNSGADIEHPGTVPVSISATADLAISMAANPNPVEVVDDFELTLGVELKDEGPATSVRVEVGILPGSEVIAAGDADWECSILDDLLTCDGPNFVQGGLEADEIRVQLTPPPVLGTAAITATVNLAEQDLQGDDNRSTVSLQVVEEDVIPSVESVTSAARVEGGALDDGATVNVALTQLRVAFNEPVQEADDVDNFLLVEAGPDGVWQTESLVLGLAGDDVAVPFDEITYESQAHTTVLGMPQVFPLPSGQYLLLVGRGIYDTSFQFLDGDGDGSEGGDFQRTWTVERQHLTVNPNFDRSLVGWVTEVGPEGDIHHEAVDAEGVPSSGSLVIEHLGGPSVGYSAGQCIPVEPGERLAFGGRLFLDPEGAWQTVELHVEVWGAAACSEMLLDAATQVVPLEGADGGEPRWEVLPFGYVDVPGNGQTVLLSLSAVAEDNAGPAVIRLDNIEVFSTLFADGFETGDTSGWSRTAGN